MGLCVCVFTAPIKQTRQSMRPLVILRCSPLEHTAQRPLSSLHKGIHSEQCGQREREREPRFALFRQHAKSNSFFLITRHKGRLVHRFVFYKPRRCICVCTLKETKYLKNLSAAINSIGCHGNTLSEIGISDWKPWMPHVVWL